MKIQENFPNVNKENQEWESFRIFLDRSGLAIQAVIDNKPRSVARKQVSKRNRKLVSKLGVIKAITPIEHAWYTTEIIRLKGFPKSERELQTICAEVSQRFGKYAKEIIEREGITIAKISNRTWQSIEDPDWKQCIIELTLQTESRTALRIWDELSDELDRFVDLEPENIRPFLKENLTLDIKWC